MTETAASSTPAGTRWLAHPAALPLAVALVYLPSLWGDWLDYDDDWLVRDNELLTHGSLEVIPSILLDFDRDTRLVLGAEYLPVRDLLTWALRGVVGLDVTGLRVAVLGLYVLAIAALQRSMMESPPAVRLAVWLFALHPVHAESVAWLAGIKDVLSLLFVTTAGLAYGLRHARLRYVVPVLVGLACFSKAAAVIAPGLLWAFDLLENRRADRPILAASLAVAALAAGVHAWVGTIVSMYAEPLSEGWLDRFLTLATMLVRYLGLCFLVSPSSVFYEVAPTGPTWASLGALALLVGAFAVAAVSIRRGVRWPAISLGVFLVGLLPVMQIVAPLQNRMADRYLLFALLGPMLMVGFGLEALLTRVRPTLATIARGAAVTIVALLALVRGLVFADAITLFDEATERAPSSAAAPYMLAEAYLRAGRTAEAEAAYRLAMDRDGLRTRRGLGAANNLGRLLVSQGRVDEAEALYAELVARYPEDPRALFNLSSVEALRGEREAAERHRAELAERFPTYRPHADLPGPL